MSDDLRILVDNLISNKSAGEMLDYKEELSFDSDKQKKELAKDMAAFANTKGGHILVGVKDKVWTPVGVGIGSIDKTKIFQIADTRISPSLTVSADFVNIADLRFLLISIQ